MVLRTIWVTLAASLAGSIDLFVDCFLRVSHILLTFPRLELFYISGLKQDILIYSYSQAN